MRCGSCAALRRNALRYQQRYQQQNDEQSAFGHDNTALKIETMPSNMILYASQAWQSRQLANALKRGMV
jgi:hypothetical protein